jgi:tetratricopeptide (TPR) repeat protein/2-polyprenyl-3-methyl-5-hydroxy-6-metoxy-1,4-benzoquinol methylase
MAKKPQQRDGFRAAQAATEFSAALRAHQAGRMQEAEQHYRQVLAADAKHIDALHLFGVLAHQVGRSDAAVELIGKALALDERVPDFHYNIGLAYGALGRLDEAAAHNRKAIALKPDYAEAHMNLGNALAGQGKHAEAIRAYERVLALRPSLPEGHYNLANTLAALGRPADAAARYHQALALRPDYAEAHNNLGTVLMAQGNAAEAAERHQRALALKPSLAAAYLNLGNALRAQGKRDEAIGWYRQALARDADNAEAHNNLGAALLAHGEVSEAAACFRRALALKPGLAAASVNLAKVSISLGDLATALATAKRLLDAGDPQAPALFFWCFRDPGSTPFAAAYRAELIRAMAEPWGMPRVLAGTAASLLKAHPAIGPIVEAATIGPGEIATLAADDLLGAHLVSVQVGDAALERLLTAVRRALPETDRAAQDTTLAFACALARQCFINEYVFACTEHETHLIRLLREAVAAALRAQAHIAPFQLATLACYAPLHSVPDARELLAREWPAPVRALLDQQVREPAQEAQIRSALPRLTPIEDSVSRAVRAQYEENPYPRWTGTASTAKPQPLLAYLHERFPLAPLTPYEKPTLDYLVAGCGTGQQTAGVLQAFSGVNVTAIDLSLASLSYARRMTDALGLKPIAYGQADILELGSLGRTFDVVDSAGVLHHMAEPLAGWRVLTGLLAPGGIMRIALYSTIARRDITVARRLIAERGWPATPDGIRTARQAILALPDGAPEKTVASLIDFFALSDCRDLLFHAQEHTFGLPAVASFLSENGLEFLGFEVAPHVGRQYAERFPGDAAQTNLDHWNLFEQDNPDTFIATYQFWAQKRAAPVSL